MLFSVFFSGFYLFITFVFVDVDSFPNTIFEKFVYCFLF